MSAHWTAIFAAGMLGLAIAAGVRAERPPPALPAPTLLQAQQKERATPETTKSKSSTGQPAPAIDAAPAAEAPAPQAGPGTVGEFQPVLHAQEAKIATCMDTILGQSGTVIDSAHTAISSWTTAAPNDNAFLSIIGLSYANKAAPNAAAIVVAAPLGPGKCQGATVQIYPIAQSCSAIQAGLIKEGQTIAMLRALPVVETKSGFRDVLIPTAGGGCVLVVVGLPR